MKAKKKTEAPEIRYVMRDGVLVPELVPYVVHYKFADGSTVTVDKTAIDAIDRSQHERLRALEASETNRANASNPRNPVTKDDLVAFREQFEKDNGRERGWKAAACRKFLIDPGTLESRMTD